MNQVSDQHKFVQVVIDSPLRRHFDYLPPQNCDIAQLKLGLRVQVSFGHRITIGMITGFSAHSVIPQAQMKAILKVLDETPLLSESLFQLALWTASYYQHPLGDVLFQFLPIGLRDSSESKLPDSSEYYWQLTELGATVDLSLLKRSPKQIVALELLRQQKMLTTKHNTAIDRTILNRLCEKNLVIYGPKPQEVVLYQPISGPVLHPEQQQAVTKIRASFNGFQVFLLHGITGSGKTEVYLQLINKLMQNDQQVLVLVPEISLTPQMVERFTARFNLPVVTLHSGLTAKQRLTAWLAAKNNQAKIIIGTRSAIFTPLPALGLIIIDEEHDASFKQQEGFRYNARDLAIMRAKTEQIPIVLGSATPSLESYFNAKCGKYQYLTLLQRAGNAKPPQIELVDLRKYKPKQGFSVPLLNAIRTCLVKQEQVLLFLNRRGFAPILLCDGCGWLADCPNCDAHLTYHQKKNQLHCHHCGKIQPAITLCPQCKTTKPRPHGLGTERVEEFLATQFPDTPVIRFDRDTISHKETLVQLLTQVQQHKAAILIGTQMLAKGHHFQNITLAAILDADSGLFFPDFRANERTAQLLLQVAGRAGREIKCGQVLIQTYHPEHPLLTKIRQQDYDEIADFLQKERETAQLPPYTHLALFRAEAKDAGTVAQFLKMITQIIRQNDIQQQFALLGPAPSPMARKANVYRGHLLVKTYNRSYLQHSLQQILPLIDEQKAAKRVQWSVDIDPQEMS